MMPEDCHAVRVRLAGPAAPGPLTERLAALAGSRLWVEDVPSPAAGPVAARRRAAELVRPATRVRSVLLRYADGLADLVIVGPRDRPLPRLAAAALTAAEPGAAEPAAEHTGSGSEPRATGPRPVHAQAPAPSWGLGRAGATASGTLRLDLPAGADPADRPGWQRALEATVRWYAGQDATGAEAAVGWLPGPGTEDAEPVVDEYLPCLAPVLPLTLSLAASGHAEPQLRCDFRLSHFAPLVVEQFARHLVLAYGQLRGGRDVPDGGLQLMSGLEEDEVVRLGRPKRPAGGQPGPVGTVPDAFAVVATARPDAVAVCDRGARLSFRELDERSGRLANGLRVLGVGAGDRVGICLERTAELVVTMLGVLKAGAAYVPTDPAYPAARLAHTAQDAGLRVVVTRLADFPAGDAIRTVTPDELIGAGTGEPHVAGDAAGADDPAYVIYTSGSTGRPKGVVVPHRNVISLLDATRDDFGLGPRDVWTLFHSSAFDFSVWEIWGCLLTGGRLVVVPYSVSREPDRFADLLAAERVTVLSQTPSAFAQLIQADPAGLALRLVIFGGEPLDTRMLLPWFDRHPESACRLVNMFGITETTVHVTAQTVTRSHALAASRSVGTALPGWQLYVLDPAGRLLPPGVTGEIYVGGAGVALGYLNQPGLTAERFLPDPWSGGRMYRSGDRGRLLPDGRLEHLGRIDSQVKIRGFRIELDEIRAVLLEDPLVRAAAVVVRHGDPADPATARLDAYVVLTGPDRDSVRRRAAELLPEHMVPASVTALDALPLTTNGKLDASRLPLPTAPAGGPDRRPALADGVLAAVTQVWAEVLSRDVSPDDDFFELGGNSLLAVRISAAMRGRGLPPLLLRDLFRHPSARALADALAGDPGEWAGAVRAGARPPAPAQRSTTPGA